MLMAAEVSSLVRVLSRYREKEGERERGLVTRALLDGCNPLENKELDLDLKVPNGWEKRLDLMSGEVYFHRSSNTTRAHHRHNPLHGLTSPPLSTRPSPNLDLKLCPPPPSGYQSVCTLDKVRSALHRLEATGPSAAHKPKAPPRFSPSPSASTASTSTAEESSGGAAMVAVGCSRCLSYVLVAEGGGRCPRCNSTVEATAAGRKRRRRAGDGGIGVDLELGLSVGRAAGGGGGEGLL